MAKPIYIERLTASGDTIPASKPAGGGGGANRVEYYTNASTGTGGSYSTGTRMMGYQSDKTSADFNRAFWYLANCVDSVREHEFAMPNEEPFVAVGAGDAERLISYPVYLGETGFTAADIPRVMSVWDANRDELIVTGTQVVVASIYTQTGGGGGAGVPLYPAGGLPAVNTTPGLVDGATAGTNLVLQGAGIVSAAIRVSLFNYSRYLRGLRDSDSFAVLANCFATIEVVNIAATDFTMHRDVVALGWLADDEIYISHFAANVYLNFNVTIPLATNYIIPYGTYRVAGNLEEEAIMNYAITGGNKLLPLGWLGLDAAYDRAPTGAAGSGRLVTADSGPIELSGMPLGDFAHRVVGTNADRGETVFDAVDDYLIGVGANAYSANGFMYRKLMDFNDETIISGAGEAATGNAAGQVTLTAGPPANQWMDGASDYNLMPGVDLVWVEDGAGDPVGTGLYYINSIDTQVQITVKNFDGSAPDLTAAATVFVYRPVVALPARFPAAGSSGALFTSYFDSKPAVRMYAGVNGAASGVFTEAYVGDINVAQYISQQYPYECPSTAGDYSMATLARLARDAGGEGILLHFYDNDSVTNYRRWVTQDVYTAGGSEFAFSQTGAVAPATPSTQAFELFPFGPGNGFMVGVGPDTCVVSVELGDYSGGPAPASGRLWAQWYAGAPDRSEVGLMHQVWNAGAGGRNVNLLLKEAPTAPKAPGGGATDRCELTSTANYGYSAARTFSLQYDAAVAQPVFTLGPVAFTWWFNFNAGDTRWSNTDDDSDQLIFPLDLPHDCVVKNVYVRLGQSANYTVTNAIIGFYEAAYPIGGPVLVTKVKENAAVNGGGAGDAEYAVDPVADFSHTVDKGGARYYCAINAGTDGGGVVTSIYHVRVKVEIVDILP